MTSSDPGDADPHGATVQLRPRAKRIRPRALVPELSVPLPKIRKTNCGGRVRPRPSVWLGTTTDIGGSCTDSGSSPPSPAREIQLCARRCPALGRAPSPYALDSSSDAETIGPHAPPPARVAAVTLSSGGARSPPPGPTSTPACKFANDGSSWKQEYEVLCRAPPSADALAALFRRMDEPIRPRGLGVLSAVVCDGGQQCAWCFEVKAPDSFAWRTSSKITRRRECMACQESGLRICSACGATFPASDRAKCNKCTQSRKGDVERKAKADATRDLQLRMEALGIRVCSTCCAVKTREQFRDGQPRCVDCERAQNRKDLADARGRDAAALAAAAAASGPNIRCRTCGVVQGSVNFGVNRSTANGLDKSCRRCRSASSHQLALQSRLARYALIQRLGGKCAYPTCDVTDPELLDLDHVNRAEKTRTKSGIGISPSEMSRKALQAEAARASLRPLCAFHHRVVSQQQLRSCTRPPKTRPKRFRPPSARSKNRKRVAVNAEKLRRGRCAAVECTKRVEVHTCAGFDFDHEPGSHKTASVSEMSCTSARYSLDQVLEEMAGTTLLCANCHRSVTNARRRAVGPARLAVQPTPRSAMSTNAPDDLALAP